MPANRTPYEIAAGRLISAIQKEWHRQSGESTAEIAEGVMYAAHDLLKAGDAAAARELLGSRSVEHFLGETWVRRHPSVRPAIEQVELQLLAAER